MSRGSELRIVRTARVDDAKTIRHALHAFLHAIDVEESMCDDVLTAVGEALVNAMEHAYAGTTPSDVEVFAHVARDGGLEVEVSDKGTFIERESSPERGLGFTIMRAIARAVTISTNGGTTVRMVFGAPRSLHSV